MGDPGATVIAHDGIETSIGFPSPDVYFLPGYGRAAATADGGDWVLLEVFDGAWQVPVILRTLVDGARDAISPAYTGAYTSSSLSSAQIQVAWSMTVDWLARKGAISLLLRHSPLVSQATNLPGLRSIVSGHPTIVLELADEESAWADMEGRCRTSIRKAVKHGYTAHIRLAESGDLASSGEFRRLYELTMQRRAAAPLYFFSDAYYEQLLDALGPNLLIGEVRDSAGVVVSAALLMRHLQRLHYHLAGSSPDAARMGSNNLMLWTAIRFAVAEGLRQFHLGGGVGVRDDLFKFKRSFGGHELEYGVSGLIIDPALYQIHTQRRAKACHLEPDELLASNFFPAYRAGTVSV